MLMTAFVYNYVPRVGKPGSDKYKTLDNIHILKFAAAKNSFKPQFEFYKMVFTAFSTK